MAFDPNSKLSQFAWSLLSGYNHQKYWSRRQKVIDSSYKNSILKLYFLIYIKRIDAKFNCSFGTNYNAGATFAAPPKLPHGPKGIIVGHDVTFGHGVTIYQHSTVTHGGKTIIGNNVLIGAGAVILPGCHLGENSKVGANAVVTEEIPQNATVVPQKCRIILK